MPTNKIYPHSFTAKYSSRQREIITTNRLVDPFADSTQKATPLEYISIWDTGATNSVISQRVVTALNLQPIGYTTVMGVNGSHDSPQFIVGIILPNNLHFEYVEVTLGDLGTYDVLIGMDIIGNGSFSLTHRQGFTVFSFSIPSLETIDFVVKYPIKKQGISQSYKPSHKRK